jgi:hypothetical protein
MRFQDAAQDARAVTYAAIQAEPVVARAAGLLADATVAPSSSAVSASTTTPRSWLRVAREASSSPQRDPWSGGRRRTRCHRR